MARHCSRSTDAMQILAVTVAWCAVWLCGAALTAALRGPFDWRAPGEAAWTKGVGFLIGAFVLTMWMRGLSAMGVAFGRASVLLPIVALAVAALYVAQRRGALRWPAMRMALVDAVRLRELAGW